MRAIDVSTKRAEFTRKTKALAFERCRGLCEECGRRLTPGRFEYHHIVEAAIGGDASLENCKVICDDCHDPITRKHSTPMVAKVKRVRDRHIGAKSGSKYPPMKGTKRSGWKRKFDGTWERRN